MKERLIWIDVLKGFAIILVIIGHVADGYINSSIFQNNIVQLNIIYNIIYSFHMPLFFIISGYLAYISYYKNYEQKRNNIIRQICNLVWLYLFFSIVQWIFKFLVGDVVNNKVSIDDLTNIFFRPMTPYWYIYELIFFYIIEIIVNRLKINNKTTFFILLILLIGIGLLNFQTRIYDFIKFYIFFKIGFVIDKIELNKFIYLTMFLFGIIGISIFVLNGIIVSKEKFIDILIAILISIPIIKCFQFSKNINYFKILKKIGCYSTEIYLIHCYFTFLNRVVLLKFGINNFSINFILNCLISTSVSMLIAYSLKKIRLSDYIFNPVKKIYQMQK